MITLKRPPYTCSEPCKIVAQSIVQRIFEKPYHSLTLY